jgi:glycosyltransferase involved in cell wall biosynthesis
MLNLFKKKRIAYLVPHLNIAGGIIVVLQHVVRLSRMGHDAYVINMSGEGDAKWFPYFDELKIVNFSHEPLDEYENIDIMIATSWDTFEMCSDVMRAGRKLYFVQADERGFTKDRGVQQKVNRAYQTDGVYITEALWIQRWLKEEYGHDAYYVPNGLDSKITYRTEQIQEKIKKTRVLIEGPINVQSKGMDDAYDAVKGLNVELWIVSSNGVPRENWKYDRFFENVPFDKMNEIYSSCDIFLKMSRNEGFFGPPMEAMACGCAVVVGKVMGYDEYITDGYNASVVEQRDIKGAKEAIQNIIDDVELRDTLVKGGYKTAKKWTWDRSMRKMKKVINNRKIKQYYTDTFPERYNFKKFD